MRGQYKNKRDANEGKIFKTLRAHGIQVYSTDQPLDAICAYKGTNYLVEVKNGPKASYRKGQVKFLGEWEGQAVVLTGVAEAEKWAKSVRDGSAKAGVELVTADVEVIK